MNNLCDVRYHEVCGIYRYVTIMPPNIEMDDEISSDGRNVLMISVSLFAFFYQVRFVEWVTYIEIEVVP